MNTALSAPSQLESNLLNKAWRLSWVTKTCDLRWLVGPRATSVCTKFFNWPSVPILPRCSLPPKWKFYCRKNLQWERFNLHLASAKPVDTSSQEALGLLHRSFVQTNLSPLIESKRVTQSHKQTSEANSDSSLMFASHAELKGREMQIWLSVRFSHIRLNAKSCPLCFDLAVSHFQNCHLR